MSDLPSDPRSAVRDFARNAYSEAILDAAERLFLEVGYHESKMSDVAAQAGVAVGTVYKHFPSKESLLASLAQRRRELVFISLEGCSTIENAVERLHAMLERALLAAEEGGALFAVYIQLRNVVESQLQAGDGLNGCEMEDRLQEAMVTTYQLGVDQGVFRSDVSPARFASALCGALNAEMTSWVQAGRVDSLTERGRALLDLLLQGTVVR